MVFKSKVKNQKSKVKSQKSKVKMLILRRVAKGNFSLRLCPLAGG
jgi:hypothetical protein